MPSIARLARRLVTALSSADVRTQRGLALPLALGVLTALSVSTTGVVYATSSNSRATDRDGRGQLSLALAEAGLNNAMAILSSPTQNSLQQSTLPRCTVSDTNPTLTTLAARSSAAYEGGSAYWCGDLILDESAWRLEAVGSARNPNGSEIMRTIKAYVPIQPVVSQNNNVPAWNYIYATNTGAACDMTLSENVTMSSALFVEGNLCLNNNAHVRVGPLVVKRRLSVGQSNSDVGESGARIEVSVGGWDDGSGLKHCKLGNGAFHVGCGDADKVFSKLSNGTAGVNQTPGNLTKPASDYGYWYESAVPGPKTPCTDADGEVEGAAPVLDTNYPSRDNSVPAAFNLTPASDYTCRVGSAANPVGELSWDWNPATQTGTMKLRGVVYLDGSAYSNNGKVNRYDGQGTLYLSGTFLLDNNTLLCGVVDGGGCDSRVPSPSTACPPTTGWNPNCELLTIIAGGDGGAGGAQSQGGQIPPGFSTVIDNSSMIQAALYAQSGIKLSNNSSTDGPIIGATISVSQNYTGDEFGTLTTVPPGMPGNPVVYAQPNPPQSFSS